MLESLRGMFSSVDWEALLSNFSNDKMIEYFTHPIGIGIVVVLLVASIFLKWRVTFTVLSGILAISFLMRYVLVGDQEGPNKLIFPFAAGAVIIGACVIYFLFIRDD